MCASNRWITTPHKPPQRFEGACASDLMPKSCNEFTEADLMLAPDWFGNRQTD